jgi:quinol monooxygenase YgiN
LPAIRRRSPAGSEDIVVFYEVYDSRAVFEAHLETPHLARLRDAFPPLIVEEKPVRFAERLHP